MAGDLVRVVQWERQSFGRPWTAIDIVSIVILLSVHGLALLAPFYFTWSAVWMAVALALVTGLGLSLSFHRNLTHRSFRLPKWLEYFFAYCALLSIQGSPIEWVSTHRTHHQFVDTSTDPHTPLKGFWYSHIIWICDYHSRFATDEELKNVGDLKKQWFYRFLHYTYGLHVIAHGALLYATGGLPFLTWGLGVRTLSSYHTTFSLNSICHSWGNKAYDTGDSSRNNWFLGWIALGEGWHNNHHAFEYSARLGLEWWQIDVTWYVIRFLEVVGLATDVKRPSEDQKKQKAIHSKVN